MEGDRETQRHSKRREISEQCFKDEFFSEDNFDSQGLNLMGGGGGGGADADGGGGS